MAWMAGYGLVLAVKGIARESFVGSGRAEMGKRTTAMAALLAVSCARGVSENQVVTRDSAGVRIVETEGERWPETGGWRIDPEPALQIGVVEGDSVYQFFRVFSAVRLSDGRIVTADRTTNRLRFFNRQGEFLASVGGRGSGPGEFQGLYQVSRFTGDSLLAYDGSLRRVTLLDANGTIVSTLTLTQPGPEPISGVARLSDGRIVAMTGWSSSQLEPPFEPGLTRSPSPVFVFDAAGNVDDTLGIFPGMDMAITLEGGRIGMGPPPFGHMLSMAVYGDHVFVGTGDTYEVDEYTPTGTLVRVLRGPSADLRVDPGALQAFTQAYLAVLPDAPSREREQRRLASIPLPATKPAFSRILADDVGNLWLSPFESFAYIERTWTIVNQDGAFLGKVVAPPGLRILDVGENYVLGRWQDESQVEFIQVHRIIRS